MRLATLSFIVVSLCRLVCALPACATTAMDEDFTVFLPHFIHARPFRQSRMVVPLPVIFGSECDQGVKNSKWSARLIAKNFIVPLTREQLAAQGLSQRLTEVSSTEVTLFQYRDEADSYLVTYT